MKSQVFINLAVKDLEKSIALYEQMGFTKNPQFSDDTACCMVFSEEIFVMLLTHEKFKTFATKPIADTKNNLAGLFALSVDSLSTVNKIVDSALKAGATEPRPFTDHGFMQLRVLEDFDGHTWEIFCMDMSKFPQGQ
jgi:uncharacterized protein